MRLYQYIFFSLILVTLQPAYAQQADRWQIQKNGSITWKIRGTIPHADDIEMSGEKVSLWTSYRIDTPGIASIRRTVVFPTFRMLPDDTRSHIAYTFNDDELPRIYIDDRLLKVSATSAETAGNVVLKVDSINQHGIMRIYGQAGKPAAVYIERSFFPSVDKPLAIEKFLFTNNSHKPVTVVMEQLRRETTTDTLRSKGSPHTVIVESAGAGRRTLQPGGSAAFYICYLATDRPASPTRIDPAAEEEARVARIAEILAPLQLNTPDSILNTAFNFAKIRATESIYKTKAGYLHSPGGLEYYAAIWANDQAEYVSPYFAFSGDRLGDLSAMTCYELFARYMTLSYDPLPSSIVAEGDTVWKGAGDRGDQAMIAYGSSRFALAYGNVDSAKKLWPLISWCLEYSRRHINPSGVVASATDELEGRFPAGKANLSTNCLYYDALVSAALLARQLHLPDDQARKYTQQAAELKENIGKYFAADIHGFKTYRYYEGNTTLRSWICMPLAMGIYDRSAGTIAALFSPRLWTADGLATEEGKTTFWDRSTLYALRGALQAGATEKVISLLHYYSQRRLLGEHVPYPVEAYPEGNQRHLSAESGLYCRIFTEGLFGMRPAGFNSFDCTPRLPAGWGRMALKNINAFGGKFDLKVFRDKGGKIVVEVIKGARSTSYKIKDGETAHVTL